jgi:hypothetical protein
VVAHLIAAIAAEARDRRHRRQGRRRLAEPGAGRRQRRPRSRWPGLGTERGRSPGRLDLVVIDDGAVGPVPRALGLLV